MSDNISYKIVVVGGGGVGKSAITIQFLQNHFITEYDPTIEESYRKQVTVDGETILLDILDTAGQEEYSAMREQYLRTGQGFLLVYSVTSRTSFEETLEFRDLILQAKNAVQYPICLVANKIDLVDERVINDKEGKSMAEDFSAPYIETSAKTGENIEDAFFALVRVVKEAIEKNLLTDGKSKRPKGKRKCTIL
ncbi:ras-like protein rasd [Anaeramoeba flamelloides]|uniref:Ras-like protein rasd n=1 Tax=Anaeramoeba flamelloides TaxID=1746091 RepID=A0AAV7YCF3_9EUKA|nr:ras-like protein rasd [Anaeramoeba flamelloides]